jgi:hypothetical protein
MVLLWVLFLRGGFFFRNLRLKKKTLFGLKFVCEMQPLDRITCHLYEVQNKRFSPPRI